MSPRIKQEINNFVLVIEITAGDYGNYTGELVKLANKRIAYDAEISSEEQMNSVKINYEGNSSFWIQFSTLMYRSYIQEKNNTVCIFISLSLFCIKLVKSFYFIF